MKPLDPILIKQAVNNGQLVSYVERNVIYIKDTITGDCVKIGEVTKEQNNEKD